jgi:DNA-binding transcriptional regulator LsrR (DeoR family)
MKEANTTSTRDARNPKESENLSLAADVAWLHLVQRLTQAEIADRRGLSRMKVHRLLQLAYENGLVRVFVDRAPSFCMDLENELISSFGLTSCMVAPDGIKGADMFASMAAVSTAAASFLFGRMEPTEPRTVGIGSGRTMAATARALPSISRPETTFASLTGDFAVLNDANPFEVINTLTIKTGGKGHAFTAPLIVDTPEDRDLFLRQRSVAHAMNLLENADFFFTGLGHVGRNSFFESYGLLSKAELEEVRDLDVAADIAGNLLSAKGEFITGGIARRTLGIGPAALFSHELVVVAGGVEKSKAALAALRSGSVNGFITCEGVANRVLAKA